MRYLILLLLFTFPAVADFHYIEDRDALTGTDTSAALSAPLEGKGNIMVSCSGGLPFIVLDTGKYVPGFEATVAYKVDDGEIVTGRWLVSSNRGVGLYGPEAIPLANLMAEGTEFIIRANVHRGAVTSVHHTAGLKESLEKLSCFSSN